MKHCYTCNTYSDGYLCEDCGLCGGCCNCDDNDMQEDYIQDLEEEAYNINKKINNIIN